MKKKIEKYLQVWEERCYFEGIPDEVPNRINQLHKAPSYKAVAIAILNNDFSLKSLGFSEKKCKSYHELKRIEIESKLKNKQLKLF